MQDSIEAAIETVASMTSQPRRDRARREAGAPRELVRRDLAGVGERVEDGEPASAT